MINEQYKSDLCDVLVRILRRSGRAVLAQPASRKKEPAWLPLSNIEIHDEGRPTVMVTGPEWLFRAKGWL
jgi:hypothetical protein